MEQIQRIFDFCDSHRFRINQMQVVFNILAAMLAVLVREKLWSETDTNILIESLENLAEKQ